MTALLLALFAWVLPQAPAAVRGVVIDAATKQPIAHASVLLIRPERLSQSMFATTDDRGRFAFANAAPAAYRLRAERDGYVRGDVSAAVAVEAGSAPPDVTLTLTPTAVISGRVTDEFGDPAPRVFVRALTTRMVAEARTNDLGEYRLFDLPPGAYVISAERYTAPSIQTDMQLPRGRTMPGASLVTPTAPCPDCPGEGRMSQPVSMLLAAGAFIDPRALANEASSAVYYPGTPDRSAATPVKAPAGARVDAIDLRLAR